MRADAPDKGRVVSVTLKYFPHVVGDGQRSLREIWNIACTRLGDDAPTQDEVIQILASLHRADVLRQLGYSADAIAQLRAERVI